MNSAKLRILVIEDHLSTQHVMVRMLRRAGYEVSPAITGEEASRLVATSQFDLVITDIGLPGINGWELLGKVREEQPQIRAIALTGFGYPADMQRSAEVGFDTHITKPAEWGQVEAAVKSLFP